MAETFIDPLTATEDTSYRAPERVNPDFIYMSPTVLERSDFVASDDYEDPMEPRIIEKPDYAGYRAAALAAADDFVERMRTKVDRAEGTFEKVFLMMHANHYRAGTRKQSRVDDSREAFAAVMQPHIDAGTPLEFVLPAFPFKLANPFKVARREPDMAEILCLSRMYEIAQVIASVHPPGARFHLVSDGVAYGPLFGVTQAEARLYRDRCREMIDAMGYGDALAITDLQDLIDARMPEFETVRTSLDPALRRWWKDNTDDLRRASILSSAAANINLSQGITHDLLRIALDDILIGPEDDKALDNLRRVRSSILGRTEEAAYQFVLLLYTMREANVLNDAFPRAIRATVHPKPGQWSPHLVNRASKVFPWQGIAVDEGEKGWRTRYEFDAQQRGHRPVHLRDDPCPFYYETTEEA
ncbi:L-tyrosine/L-tryptophan isonitrile synthase family protein [Actinomadura flavalba]|uniref:L-tyrosine/L-tryptophan isonitrile synthase family protein n=1 Tax=Actinomadura flavalba TaxID=1120938 RepID=UPI00036F0824|nr:L-tyrosine/L-tryptophan isonitrile synthase family protein [Actinomadura flavalba]